MNINQYNTEKNIKELNSNKIPRFNFKGNCVWARCLSVYDGDTITVAFYVAEGSPFKFAIRLLGLDTPEIRSKNLIEKRKAIKARDFLRGLILGENIFLKLGDYDKYGRLLADVYLGEGYPDTVSQQMIDAGHGYYYDGGKKRKIIKKILLIK